MNMCANNCWFEVSRVQLWCIPLCVCNYSLESHVPSNWIQMSGNHNFGVFPTIAQFVKFLEKHTLVTCCPQPAKPTLMCVFFPRHLACNAKRSFFLSLLAFSSELNMQQLVLLRGHHILCVLSCVIVVHLPWKLATPSMPTLSETSNWSWTDH